MNVTTVLELALLGQKQSSLEQYQQIIDLCKKELAESAIKKKGSTELKRYKEALKLIKEIPAEYMKLNGTWLKDGKQYLCNGYMALELTNHIDNLPIIDNSRLNIDKIFDIDLNEYELIDAPNVTSLDNGIKIAKATYKAEHNTRKTPTMQQLSNYDGGYFNHNNWYCNPHYLSQCIKILGTDVKLYIPKTSIVSAAYLENENGRAILLPIKKLINDKKEV